MNELRRQATDLWYRICRDLTDDPVPRPDDSPTSPDRHYIDMITEELQRAHDLAVLNQPEGLDSPQHRPMTGRITRR